MTEVNHNPALLPPGAVGGPHGPAPARPARTQQTQGPSFADVLASKAAEVKFSGHAMQRVERRGIDLSGGTLERLQEGVQRAAGKGAREAVVFVEDTAFVVSVRNKTVITAVDADHMREHVFTNIDSAVIA